MRPNNNKPFQEFVLKHRQTLRGIPGLLAADSDEAAVMKELISLVLGNPTSEVPQCSILSIPVSEDYASAMFLGNTWALTALHALSVQSSSYVVTLPITAVVEVKKANSFEVSPTPAPNDADLALLQLNGSPQVGALRLATDNDLSEAGVVQLCGFGSDNCELPSRAGIKRLSDPYPIMANPATLGVKIDSATQFVVQNTPATPLVCISDSGGGAVIAVGGGEFKLAGIITGQIVSADGVSLGVTCVRLSAFSGWIKHVTGLQLS